LNNNSSLGPLFSKRGCENSVRATDSARAYTCRAIRNQGLRRDSTKERSSITVVRNGMKWKVKGRTSGDKMRAQSAATCSHPAATGNIMVSPHATACSCTLATPSARRFVNSTSVLLEGVRLQDLSISVWTGSSALPLQLHRSLAPFFFS